ncbi:MAG: sigma-70 family RNA polymerase sigma factor [Chloroflexi bacterium]|nr:sigma-70 family RNA polymerase sigma factor [Chloroflexota bacterium]
MTTASPPNPSQLAAQSDTELVAAATGGDRAAFAALYDRHADALYDFAIRIVRDADLAADVVQGTYVNAWEQLSDGRAPTHFKAWLFTVARNAAIDEQRHGRRQIAADGAQTISFTAVDEHTDSNPERLAQRRELADLVWGAATGLSPGDYALLDMHVRQGMPAEELADALGITRGAMYTRLSRLRTALAESVGAVLLLRSRDRCNELDAISAQPAPLDRRTRNRIQRHIRGCSVCSAREQHLVAPEALFAGLAGLALIAVPAALRGKVVAGAVAANAGASAGGSAGASSGVGSGASVGAQASSASTPATAASNGLSQIMSFALGAGLVPLGALVVMVAILFFSVFSGGSTDRSTEASASLPGLSPRFGAAIGLLPVASPPVFGLGFEPPSGRGDPLLTVPDAPAASLQSPPASFFDPTDPTVVCCPPDPPLVAETPNGARPSGGDLEGTPVVLPPAEPPSVPQDGEVTPIAEEKPPRQGCWKNAFPAVNTSAGVHPFYTFALPQCQD